MSEPIYRVEYLVVIDTNQGFCASLESFRKFLESHDGLVLTKQKIKFRDESYTYDVDNGVIEGADETYFHLKMNFKKEDQNAQDFLLLLHNSLTKVSVDSVEILRDDYSRERSEQSYPLLYDVENLMRKLITKFMRINVGMHWVETVVPEKADARNRDDENSDESYVHNYDFIELTRFLFSEYEDKGSRKKLKKISFAKKIEDLKLEDLKALVPQNNWDRYFSDLIECDSQTLDALWKRLYRLRCKVAHNRLFSHADHRELIDNCSKVSEILQIALDKLDQVTVEEDEKERIIESQKTFKIPGALGVDWSTIAGIGIQQKRALEIVNRQAEAFRKMQEQLPNMKAFNLGIDTAQLQSLAKTAEILSKQTAFARLGNANTKKNEAEGE